MATARAAPTRATPPWPGISAETIAAHGGRADVLGHSMGGKAAMVLALTAPERVRRLIVADMAPTSYGHSQIAYVRAMQAVDLAAVTRRADADAALAAEIPEPALRAFLLQSLTLEEGGARWRLNLDALAAEMPAIMGFPETSARFRGPTLFLTGARSDYVRPAHWPRIRDPLPRRRAQGPPRRRPLAARRRAERLHRRGGRLPRRPRPGLTRADALAPPARGSYECRRESPSSSAGRATVS